MNLDLIAEMDAATGVLQRSATLPAGCRPTNLVIDGAGVAWTASQPNDSDPVAGGSLCYFDTANPSVSGRVPIDKALGLGAPLGISLDRDGHVWTTARDDDGVVLRYAPDRLSGVAGLTRGSWTRFEKLAGSQEMVTVALDDRAADAYFAWALRRSGAVVRIPASRFPPAPGSPLLVDGAGFDTVQGLPAVAQVALAVEAGQDLLQVTTGQSAFTRIPVDATGALARPDVVSSPPPGERCPAGDVCYVRDNKDSDPHSAVSGRFTAFSAQLPAPPPGTYSYVFDSGCTAGARWKNLQFDADQPAGTTLVAQVRTGEQPTPPTGSAALGDPIAASPFTLDLDGGRYLEVRFTLRSPQRHASPSLASFGVCVECR